MRMLVWIESGQCRCERIDSAVAWWSLELACADLEGEVRR
jgi:hypothetical protein